MSPKHAKELAEKGYTNLRFKVGQFPPGTMPTAKPKPQRWKRKEK